MKKQDKKHPNQSLLQVAKEPASADITVRAACGGANGCVEMTTPKWPSVITELITEQHLVFWYNSSQEGVHGI
jgi:hypothetical protein